MMLSKGGNMSNDPCNRLAVTTNRQITWSTVIYFGTIHHFNLTFPLFYSSNKTFRTNSSAYIRRWCIELNIAWVELWELILNFQLYYIKLRFNVRCVVLIEGRCISFCVGINCLLLFIGLLLISQFGYDFYYY